MCPVNNPANCPFCFTSDHVSFAKEVYVVNKNLLTWNPRDDRNSGVFRWYLARWNSALERYSNNVLRFPRAPPAAHHPSFSLSFRPVSFVFSLLLSPSPRSPLNPRREDGNWLRNRGSWSLALTREAHLSLFLFLHFRYVTRVMYSRVRWTYYCCYDSYY